MRSVRSSILGVEDPEPPLVLKLSSRAEAAGSPSKEHRLAPRLAALSARCRFALSRTEATSLLANAGRSLAGTRRALNQRT